MSQPMKTVYWAEDIKLDAERITEYSDPTFGPVTVFHDVVIASEMVQPYEDGRALKSRDELKAYAWTVNGRWVTLGGHPSDGIISERSQVAGRTVNSRYVIDLIDPKTKRPCRAGDRADIEIFNDFVPKATLEDMKNGKKQDVSIGFFYSKDETPGTVEDGPFKGDEYDYVQRNMFHDHTAAAIENGRCPSPYCGLTADELKKNLVGDPFAGFPDFDACIAEMTKPKKEGGQGYSEETARKVCGKLQAEHEKKKKKDTELSEMAKKFWEVLIDEYEALRGERDAMKKTGEVEWWIEVDWAEDDSRTIFDALPEETRNLIVEAGLCPTCMDKARTEAERAMSHFDLTEEEWAALSEEEKQEYIDKLPKKGKGGDMSIEDINAKIEELQTKRKELKKKLDDFYKQETSAPSSTLWEEIELLDKELEMYMDAKAFKLAEGDTVDDIDGYELDYVAADAVWTYAYKAALPDSAYAYIESGCEKKDDKTQQSCRHMPIKDKEGNYDEAHVHAALTALMGGRSGKVPSYASKAKGKVCAGAKALKMESEVCGTAKKKKDVLDAREVLKRADRVLAGRE